VERPGGGEFVVSDAVLLSDVMPDLLPMAGRSPIVHVSTVIAGMCERLGYFDPNRSLSVAWAQLGCALEWATIQRFTVDRPGRYVQPGEFILDGVAGTPDLEDLDPTDPTGVPREMRRYLRDMEFLEALDESGGRAVEEIKLSWMGARRDFDDEKFWRYRVQLMAYCKGRRTRVGRLRVIHVNGFNDGDGPVPRLYQRVFTHRELDENWAVLLSNARRYHGHGNGDDNGDPVNGHRYERQPPDPPPTFARQRRKGAE
jgi:hypothetical protein